MEIEIAGSESDGDKETDIPYSVIALSLFLLSWQAFFKVPDTCVGALLAFMHYFLVFVAAAVFSEQLSIIAHKVPKNIKQTKSDCWH